MQTQKLNWIGVILCIAIAISPAMAQEYSLRVLWEAAKKNSELASSAKNISLRANLEDEKLSSRYYPEINVFAKAQYQSDVTKIDIDIPIPGFQADFPEMPKDQYQAGVSINQIIWDGGSISALKSSNMFSSALEKKTLEADIYKNLSQVNNYYFSALITDKRKSILDNMITTFEEKLKKIETMVTNGLLPESYQLELQAEILKIENQSENSVKQKAILINNLTTLTGIKFINISSLEYKIPEITDDFILERPEIEVFESSKNLINQSVEILGSAYIPKISAFGNFVYGRPGLNMFDDKFSPYFIAGVQANWNIWSKGNNNRDKQIAEIKAEEIDNSRSEFERNIRLISESYKVSIENLTNTIKKDREILILRERISAEAESRLTNGVITSSDYIEILNKEKDAEMNLELHKIELNKAKADLLVLLGQTN